VGAMAVEGLGAAYRMAMLTAKKTTRPIKKIQHWARRSKKARTRKKYQKLLKQLEEGFRISGHGRRACQLQKKTYSNTAKCKKKLRN